MCILEEVLEEYQYSWPQVNIEKIIKNQWIILEFIELEKIRWLCFEGEKNWYIAVNKSMDLRNQRFVMAHELAHVLLQEKEFEPMMLASNDYREKRADWFATELLIPNNSIIEEIQFNKDISILSRIFWVPKNIMKSKLKEIKTLR